MEELKLLISIAKRGGVGEKVRITLRELSQEIGTSPQSVMRKLEALEKEGYVIKDTSGKRTLVEVTSPGIQFLESIFEEIGKVLYGNYIVGEVVSGVGEGKYYVEQYKERIREYLGFSPYPGTLNILVVFPKTIYEALYNVEPITIPGFSKGGRTFGDVKAYKVRINGINGAIVVPSRTIHPPKVAEIIAPTCLRKKLNLKDGSKVKVEVIK
ncbi:MAG TPA: CTP-dependent riboflavin kinase [Thermococcus sp.]|uniref:CTP-dependent riboflavin kinase n=1 Tax=Thermococcus sp. TaxID=35749 RepID=UPI0017790764|nr:CTP-dependent riboflavin kinase [Thermococcus sp.]MCD6144100.1 CTP-dependent riboflavin kinase [Thermococcus sp.]HDH44050.1 CTP-dependent riboflavin kinase [Thermococcus sp.]